MESAGPAKWRTSVWDSRRHARRSSCGVTAGVLSSSNSCCADIIVDAVLCKHGDAPRRSAELVDIHRAVCCSDDQLLRVTEEMIEAHGLVREDDGGVGGMVGVEDHLDYNGHVVKFKVPSPEVRRRVQTGLEFAGRAFGEHFENRGVGYESMLDTQEELWPYGLVV